MSLCLKIKCLILKKKKKIISDSDDCHKELKLTPDNLFVGQMEQKHLEYGQGSLSEEGLLQLRRSKDARAWSCWSEGGVTVHRPRDSVQNPGRKLLSPCLGDPRSG